MEKHKVIFMVTCVIILFLAVSIPDIKFEIKKIINAIKTRNKK